MTSFRDHFSGHASAYAAHRPSYPASLIDWLTQSLPADAVIWDCGTGSGQAALALAERGFSVWATDASAAQIERATPHPRVRYRAAPAEASGLASRSVELVTVAQALHWFDIDGFNREVRRVVRPGGRVAVWCYQLFRIAPAVDALVAELYHEILRADWPPERKILEGGYRDVPWPYEPADTPSLTMEADWDLPQVVGYLDTWSACRRHRTRTGADPLEQIGARLRAAWGPPETLRTVRWPLAMRVGTVR